MLLPKAFYFFYFAAMAALVPFLTLYYKQIGLSGRQIGLLAGIPPLLTLVSAPLWSGLADATQRHKLLLIMAIGGSAVVVLVMSLTTMVFWLIPIVVVYAFFMAPVIPLVDSSVVAMLGDRKDEYGKQRLWGAVGWGAAAPIAGSLIDRTGLQWAFYGYAILMFGCLVISSRLPIRQTDVGGQFWRGLRLLLVDRQWIIFLVAVLVGGLSLAINISCLFVYLDDLGADKTLMGLSLTVATISELPVWFFSNRLLERWGTRKLLAFSLLACAVQAFAYSLIRTPWLVLPIQLLHGPAFSAMWAAGVSYASEIAPEGMGATAQGLFSSVGMGLRAALGAFVGGLLYENLGAALMFRWGGVSALLGLFLFVLASRGPLKLKPKLVEPPR
ncbi:MAG: major facilitator superfamily domain-containing protein 6 [Anaerolineae bacterium]